MRSRPPTSLAKSCRGHITTSVPLMVNITAQIYSWNLFHQWLHIFVQKTWVYAFCFVTPHRLPKRTSVSSFSLLHQAALQFHMVASALMEHESSYRCSKKCPPVKCIQSTSAAFTSFTLEHWYEHQLLLHDRLHLQEPLEPRHTCGMLN